MTIIDHAGLKVTDFRRARDFYTAALGTLGIQLLAEFEAGGKWHAGYGDKDGPTFWIDAGKQVPGEAHIAFVARSQAEVKAFHMTALANGGRDNGSPGLRPEYQAEYFAAFVLDPDGHNIEAVYVGPAEGHS